jgi:hypothetical protein
MNALYTVDSLRAGMRVEIHPASDAWMMGDRFGEVVKVGRSIVHVRMDRSGRVRWFHPESIYAILEGGQS